MTEAEHVILFVDEEQALLNGLRNALRKEPYQILTATSASDGLRVLRERRVDVVVSDERMPGVSGSDFLAYVRTSHPDTIRIMLTGQASLEAVIQAINEGRVYRFLTKPCSPLQLAQTLRDALRFLDLTREGSRLLAAVKRQRRLLREIERRHPGITSVERADDCSIVLSDESDAADLLLAMRAETAKLEQEPGRPPLDPTSLPAHRTGFPRLSYPDSRP